MYLTDEQLDLLEQELEAILEFRHERENADSQPRFNKLALILSKVRDEKRRRWLKAIDRKIERTAALASQLPVDDTRDALLAQIEQAVIQAEQTVGKKYSKWDRFRPTERQVAERE